MRFPLGADPLTLVTQRARSSPLPQIAESYDAPETRLLRLKDLLWRAARVIVDVGLSTGEMSFAEAVAFLVDRPKLEPPNAAAEVRRYTLNPLQPSSYALGRAAILALRDKARAAGWGMRYFHDRLLAAGSLPPRLCEAELGL